MSAFDRSSAVGLVHLRLGKRELRRHVQQLDETLEDNHEIASWKVTRDIPDVTCPETLK